MPDRDNSHPLVSMIEGLLDEYSGGDFREYWQLSREVAGALPIRRFYIHTKRSNSGLGFAPILNRLNVAILSDETVIDIEGNVKTASGVSYSNPNESGNLLITPLRSIESIEFHEGRIPTLQESSNAKLILIANILGRDDIGTYWIAETDDEYNYLVKFGKALTEAVTQAIVVS